ncbi:GFA family protein [Allopusillimonas soli]|uniref:GFA family protein n=1 Tax=Allopusillimonas soli TaxID=659016 RepID=A0A853F6Y0_9BURK|nr:GFA family protein [Allopusillimonas soli]NYT35578.1 GFA family protein [Allopusillimonas soli]TEA75981.1 GFA family protein [Allopusillimonas soli]
MKVQGQCHCGAIQYEAEVQPGSLRICNCLDCQIMSGSAFRTNIAASAETFHLLQGKPRHYVKTADSGAQRVHGFCEQCGTQLYATNPGTPKNYSLRAGALAQRSQLGGPRAQIWTQRRVNWMPSLDGVDEIDGQP